MCRTGECELKYIRRLHLRIPDGTCKGANNNEIMIAKLQPSQYLQVLN